MDKGEKSAQKSRNVLAPLGLNLHSSDTSSSWALLTMGRDDTRVTGLDLPPSPYKFGWKAYVDLHQ